MSDQPTLYLNPALRILPFDGDGGGKSLLELDDRRGRTLRMVVSRAVCQVLEDWRGAQSMETVLAQLRAQSWAAEAIERLRKTLEQCLHRRVLLNIDDSEMTAPEQPHKPAYMSAMLRLIPARVVNLLVPLLAPLFSRPGLLLGLLLGLCGQYLLVQALAQPRWFSSMNSVDILAAIGLTLSILLIHELGHAAAAWRAGARKVSIGVGWYVCFPVAYADLSEAWRFTAKQRALIDVAGVYMQALAVLGLLLWYRESGSAVLLAAATAGSLSILWNLNPLLRLDGYWLLSDLLRTSNLRGDARNALRLQWNRIAPASWRVEAQGRLRISARLAVALAGYALICTLFFAVIIVLAGWRFAGGLLQALPYYLEQIAQAQISELSMADRVVLFGGIAWKCVLLYFLGRFLLLLILRGAKAALRWLLPRKAVQH